MKGVNFKNVGFLFGNPLAKNIQKPMAENSALLQGLGIKDFLGVLHNFSTLHVAPSHGYFAACVQLLKKYQSYTCVHTPYIHTFYVYRYTCTCNLKICGIHHIHNIHNIHNTVIGCHRHLYGGFLNWGHP